MTILIENFGPIRKANIETKPFTMIIGKNNQGKSYCVELIFTRLQLLKLFSFFSFSSAQKKDLIQFTLSLRSYRDERNITYQLLRRAEAPFTFTKADLLLPIDTFIIKTINQSLPAFARILEDYLPLLLEERFGVKLEALVNENAENASITVDLSEFLAFSCKIFRTGQAKVEAHIKKESVPKLKEIMKPSMIKAKKLLEVILNETTEAQKSPPFLVFDTLTLLMRKLTGARQEERFRLHDMVFADSIYIPAGRAGLLEGYYSVSSAYFSLATVALPRAVSMPAMPPTASVFYNLLMEFSGNENKLSDVAKDLAKDVMNGEIVLKPDNRQPALKKIIYRPYSKGKQPLDIDIIHAGSMVKELAGLYLAIREKILPQTQLIVEEPEAHLHPSAQRKIARVLMVLASRGVFVTITTHSDIILREIAHLVGKFDKKKSDILPSSNVAVIFLKEGEKGSTSEQLVIPPSGILEGLPTFDEVIMDLYEEEVMLQSGSEE